MIKRVWTLPQRLVQQRTDRRGLKREAAVVVLSGLIGGVGMVYVSGMALNAVEGENPALRYALIGRSLQPILITLAAWILYAVLPHVLSRFYNARGPVSRLLRASAWAIVPLGLWNLVRSVTTAVAFMGKEIPADPEGMEVKAELTGILELGYTDPVYIIGFGSGIFFVVWSWIILTEGVEKAKDMNHDQALKLAAVPTGLMALYILYRVLADGGLI